VHTLTAGAYFRSSFLLNLALNLGFDFFQVLSVFFKLQAMLFFHVFDGIGIDLLDEFIGLSQSVLDILGRYAIWHHVSFAFIPVVTLFLGAIRMLPVLKNIKFAYSTVMITVY